MTRSPNWLIFFFNLFAFSPFCSVFIRERRRVEEVVRWSTYKFGPLSVLNFLQCNHGIYISIDLLNQRNLTREAFSGDCPVSRPSIRWTQKSSPHGSEGPSTRLISISRSFTSTFNGSIWIVRSLNCLLLIRTENWKCYILLELKQRTVIKKIICFWKAKKIINLLVWFYWLLRLLPR